MSKNELTAIPRAPQEDGDAPATLGAWVAGDEQTAAPHTSVKVIITPEQKRYLRYLAFDQEKSVSRVVRELLDQRMAADDGWRAFNG